MEMAHLPVLTKTLSKQRWSAGRAIVCAGLVAGTLDGLDAIVYFGLASGATPQGIFRYICGGLLGKEACHSAWYAVPLGVLLHFVIAFGASVVFYLASRWLPVIIRRPFLWGPAYGLWVYLFMSYVVVPLSRVPPSSGGAIAPAVLVNEIFAHAVLVGLPIALAVSRTASVKSEDE